MIPWTNKAETKEAFRWRRCTDGKELYDLLLEYLERGRSKNDRPYSSNTRIIRHPNSVSVKLHDTEILTVRPNGIFTLSSGGWRTVTTKARLNEFLPAGWSLVQDRGLWWIVKGNRWTSSEKMIFIDGIELPNKFKPYDPKKPTREEKKRITLKKNIDKYCKKLKEKIKNYEIEDPSGGDCWYCSMKEISTGKPWGDLADSDHLLSHIKENYFVPSLIINAMEEAGYNVSFWWGMYALDREEHRKGELKNTCYDPVHWGMADAVKKYLQRRLGIAY